MSDFRVGLVKVADVDFHPHNTRTDLGDLRDLANSISRYGVMQPIIVERYGDRLRLRAGHRRLAASRMIALPRIPAIIHDEALPEREWIEHSVQENVIRAEFAHNDRKRAIRALRQLGCTWQGIGETFGVTAATVQRWLVDIDEPEKLTAATDEQPQQSAIRRARANRNSHQVAVQRLIEAHRDEFDQYKAEAKAEQQ